MVQGLVAADLSKYQETDLLGIQCKSCIYLCGIWILQHICDFVKQYVLDGVLSGKRVGF